MKSHYRHFFSRSECVRSSFNIKNDSHTGNHPLSWRHFCLHLCSEYVSSSSCHSLIAWAHVEASILLRIDYNRSRSAVDDWHNTESLLRRGLIKLAYLCIPSGSFDLHAEYVNPLFDWWKIRLPIQFLHNISLNSELVQLKTFFTSIDLLNGCKE